MESSIKNEMEWALEGESKDGVDKTERRLRYQIKHMIVCDKRMQIASSRVAPQESYSCPSMDWDKSFFVRRGA